MSWIIVTKDHISARLSADESESYVTAADQAKDGIDILDGIIAQVTAMVRSKVGANRDNRHQMGPSGTIPDECLFAACTIARDALIGSLPLSEGATDLRKEELRKAYEFLDAVANGDVLIESPLGDASADSTSSSIPIYGGNPILDF